MLNTNALSTFATAAQQTVPSSRLGVPRVPARAPTPAAEAQHLCSTGKVKNKGVQASCTATLQQDVANPQESLQGEVVEEMYSLAQFELGEVLGAGQQGTVRRAVHLPTGREFAAKLLPKSAAAGMNPAALKKMRGEAAIMASLQQSPVVANMVASAEDDEFLYIIMELLEGGSLQEKIDGERLSEESAREVMHGVLSFLALCHEDHITFGDVKPANFMLATGHGPKIKAIDFGCSQKMVPGLYLRARVGSPLYMAPEVHLGGYGLESDMWSAGVVLYQLLTGKLPFVREENGCIVEAGQHLGYSLEGDEWTGISKDAKDLVASLLVRNRNDRLTANQALGSAWFHGASSIVEFTRRSGSEDKEQVTDESVSNT